MAILQFDASTVEPRAALGALPKGTYLAAITDSEMKPTKAGTGQYLQLVFSVLEGPHTGQKVWARLNLDNPNPTAVDIAKQELSAICHAAGKLRIADSSELHDIPVRIEVDVETTPAGGENNRIKGYLPAAGNASGKAPAQRPAATAAAGRMPWQ